LLIFIYVVVGPIVSEVSTVTMYPVEQFSKLGESKKDVRLKNTASTA